MRGFTIACLWIAALSAGVTAGASTPRRESTKNAILVPEPPPWEHYRLIVELNIFSRNRKRRSPRPIERKEDEKRPSTPISASGPSAVLVGVSRVGKRFFAFFEDEREGRVQRLSTGDMIAGMKITGISLDDVTLEDPEGKKLTVKIGMSLSGRKPAPRPPVEAKVPKARPAPTPSGPQLPPGSESILKKLMQRRLEELRK